MILINDFKAEPPELRAAMSAAADRVFASGWYVLGKELQAFERRWAEACGTPYCLGVGNGMDAIELALRALDIGPGDEVVVETVEATYTYELDTDPRELVIPFTGVWVLDRVPENPEAGGPQPDQEKGQRLITLTTCAELFHTDDRLIAFGHLVKSVRR